MLSATRLLVVAAVLSRALLVFAAGPVAGASLQFKFDFPGSSPSHYEITVPSSGPATYTSDGQLGSGGNGDPEPLQFSLSENVQRNIFDLAKKAHYFTGKVDSGNTKLANTGVKTLVYKDASHDTSATYNYSLNPAVQQLTDILQKLSTVLEFGRRLTWFHKYQKLALDDDLKQMEERQRTQSLGDVEAILPVLQQIADDSSVMRISRARALRLLATAGK
jgi:hypothetical protein